MTYLFLPAELSIGGVFMSPVLLAALFGTLLAFAAVQLVSRAGWMEFVWHPPLFYLALVVVFTVLIGVFVIPF